MLKLTPHMLAAGYEYLRTTPPFVRWKLPPADEVQFRVSRKTSRFGEYWTEGEEHVISVSDLSTGHTATLLTTLAHEMVHLHQHVTKTETKGAVHNAQFRRLAARICKYHGFDPKAFL